MMNLKTQPDHNICGCRSNSFFGTQVTHVTRERRSERGYTLVALLAFMTVLALLSMVAPQRIQQKGQREREKEAIFRGEQVADAIRDYYINRNRMTGVQGD